MTRRAGRRISGTTTTRMTPTIAAEASACPDGNDSLVSVTSRNSAGGRSRPTVALPTRTSSPAPAATTATSTASPRRTLIHSTSTATAAMIAIDTVLPTSVTVIATAVSQGVRCSIIHAQTTGSMDARPLCSIAPSIGPGSPRPAPPVVPRW